MSKEATVLNETVSLGIYGIKIEWNGVDRSGAAISSTLENASEYIFREEKGLYMTAIHAVESMILGHFCAGIDVTDKAYIEGVETALDAIANQYYGLEGGLD